MSARQGAKGAAQKRPHTPKDETYLRWVALLFAQVEANLAAFDRWSAAYQPCRDRAAIIRKMRAGVSATDAITVANRRWDKTKAGQRATALSKNWNKSGYAMRRTARRILATNPKTFIGLGAFAAASAVDAWEGPEWPICQYTPFPELALAVIRTAGLRLPARLSRKLRQGAGQ